MQKGEILQARVIEPAANIQTAHGRRWVMPLRVVTTGEVVKVWDNESTEEASPLTRYEVGAELTVRRLVEGKNYVEVVELAGLPPVQEKQTLRVPLPVQVRQRLAVVLEVYDRVLQHVGAEPDASDVVRLVELVLREGSDGGA
jgi:hypothetical protein